jgi:hypothetical protein
VRTLATFDLNGETYLFGRLNGTQSAKTWKINTATWTIEDGAQAPFGLNTVLVLAFQANNHPYLFSLDEEDGSGSIWRIADDAAGWERVYWGNHRVWSENQYSVVFSGYYRPVCTAFELAGRPHLFMKYWENSVLDNDMNPAYISVLENRNWIRVLNEGAYVAKFYIQYQHNGVTINQASGNKTFNTESVWHLPPEVQTVLLNAQGHTGLKWNVIHRGDVAVNCAYTARGLAFTNKQRLTNATAAEGKRASH